MTERYTRLPTTRALPITLDQAKTHLRIDFQSEDLTIKNLIEGARDWLEIRIARTLTNTQWKLTRSYFPWDCEIMLRFPPLVSVDAFEYYNVDNVLQLWDPANYHVIFDDFICGGVEQATDISWPTAYNRPDAIQITFTAGYGINADKVPAIIQRALLLLVGHWYEHREAIVMGTISKEVELAVDSICRALSTGNLAGSGNW